MNKVYIIGAGASRELLFSSSTTNLPQGVTTRKHNVLGPLSTGFFYDANEFAKEVRVLHHFGLDYTFNDLWLKEYIKKYSCKVSGMEISIEELLNDELKSKKINIESLYIAIEEVLSSLEKQNQTGYSTNEEVNVFLGKRELLRFIHEVFSAISYFCYSRYHAIFAQYILAFGGDVILFNWDTLLEESLVNTGQWDYWDGYGFKPIGIIDKTRVAKYKYTKKYVPSKNIVLKPHGSISWYMRKSPGEYDFKDSLSDIYIGIPLARMFRGGTVFGQGALKFNEFEGDNYKEPYEALLLPPGRKRKKFNFIWERIKSLLENADKIIAVGFSFNQFDSHIIEEFEGVNFKSSLKIELINPDPDALEKYKAVFKNTNITRAHDSFKEFCEWMVMQEEMHAFAELLQ